MKVFLEKDKLLVSCQYQDKDLVKAIGDYKWLKTRNLWQFPKRKLIDIVEKLNISYNGEITELYNNLLKEREARQNKLHWANLMKEGKAIDKSLNFDSLFSHQETALSVANLFNAYALFMETGTGKTLVAIRLLQLKSVPTIVVAPLSTLSSVWEQEIAKWSNLKCINLWQNLDAINKEADCYLLNYEHFKKLHKNGGIPEKIKFLIIDESAKLKSPKSQITKAILSYKDSIPYRLVLSGMPAPNSLLEYFGQMAFINSDLIGENFYRFRNTYFMPVGYGGFKYVLYSGAKDRIMSKISEQAFFCKKSECLDLPDRIFESRSVEMDNLQIAKYKEMVDENIMEFEGHTVLSPNELTKLMKLREVTAGFAISTEGIAFDISNSKLKVLKETLEEIGTDKQVIIWLQFRHEFKMIQDYLKTQIEFRNIKIATLYGDMPQKEKLKAIQDFQSNKVQILLAHPLSGGMGLTFVNCSYCIWYSISYSSEQFNQANDRIYRIGQLKKCTYILLLAKNTIDEVIYRALQKKIRMSDACLAMLKGGRGLNEKS